MAAVNEPSWVEDPSPAISAIKSFIRRGGGFALDEIRDKLAQERAEATREMLGKVPEEQRE